MSHLGGLMCVHTPALMQLHKRMHLWTFRCPAEAHGGQHIDVPSPYIRNHPGVVRILRRGEASLGLGWGPLPASPPCS